MRVSTLVPLGLLLGVVFGAGLAYWEYGPSGPQLAAAASSASPGDSAQPSAVVDEPVHKFGTIELGGSQSHNFTIRNTGNAPLTLSKGGPPTCKCTRFEVEDSSVPPGASGIVTLDWKGEGEIGPFRQSGEILTNDPKHPKITLFVEGELTEAVRIEPRELVFSSMPARDPVAGQVRIYAVNSEGLEIVSHQFESSEGAQQFDVSFTPLSADEVAAHKAKSGVLAPLTSKPTLPLGPIRQKISLESNLASKPALQISINGTVVSDISIIGPDWSNDVAVLRLGAIKRSEGRSRTLRLVTRGQHRKDIEFSVASKSPEFLQVSLGEMIEVNQGAVTQVPLTIAVPRGAPEANHLGSAQGKMGEVVLSTSHPDVKEVKLKVQFVVEE
jgi:hypothetical protein